MTIKPPRELQWPPFANSARRLKIAYDGDPLQLIDAVERMVNWFSEHYPDAEQISEDFTKALESYQSGESWTLDEAFGVENLRKGQHPKSYRENTSHSLPVYFQMCDALQETDNLDQAAERVMMAKDENGKFLFEWKAEKIKQVYREMDAMFDDIKDAQADLTERVLQEIATKKEHDE